MDIPSILSVTTILLFSSLILVVLNFIAGVILELLEIYYYGTRWIFIFLLVSFFILFFIGLQFYPQLYLFWSSSFVSIAITVFVIGGLGFGGVWLFIKRDYILSRFEQSKDSLLIHKENPKLKTKQKGKPSQVDDNYVKQKIAIPIPAKNIESKVEIGDDGELTNSQPFQITIYGKGDQVSDGFHLEEGSYRVRCKKKGDEGWVRVSAVSLDNKKLEPIDLDFFSSGSELLEIVKSGRYTFKIIGVFYESQWGVRVEKI